MMNLKKITLFIQKISGIKCQVVDINKAYNSMVENLKSKKKLIYPIF